MRERGPTPEPELPFAGTRREFVKRAGLAAGGLTLGSLGLGQGATAGIVARVPPPRTAPRRAAQPNILVIIVDEMRAPRWFPAPSRLAALLPNIARLRHGAVSFEAHFTAANNCTPSRSALVTGLYSHQTGCLVTGRSQLDPGFPTWGTLLREHGYQTTWWGKWHLSSIATLEPWGFSGGTFPSPNGGPGQGSAVDPHIASQFEHWLDAAGGDGPWCTTVSFVNPHDIVWWWTFTEHWPGGSSAPPMFSTLPANFETPAQLRARGKPRLQRSLQDVAAAGFGAVPFSGRPAVERWCQQRDLYLQLQRAVDAQVGRVLTALGRRRAIAKNTIVIFTSDHGEYAGSHGLRGKGGGAYDEAIQVPLLVMDPRGRLTRAPGIPRRQLTSSVDIAPLLLTIATGSSDWRADPRCSHLARRADLAAICADPAASGRRFVVHATDEVATEFCPEPYAAAAPRHVVAVRTTGAKYAIYSNWRQGGLEVEPGDQDSELYEYASASGRLELDNSRGRSALEEPMHRLLVDDALPHELRAPLPGHLLGAQARGRDDFVAVSETVDEEAARDLARRDGRRRASLDGLIPDWTADPFGGHGHGEPRPPRAPRPRARP